jgi:transposase-like protein
MAAWKSTPDERAQAAQLVLDRVEAGETLADSVRHFARALEVSEDTLRRWVRQEKAGAAASAQEPASAPVATAVLERPTEDTFDAFMGAVGTQGLPAPSPAPAWRRSRMLRVVAAVAAAFVGLAVMGGIGDALRGSARDKAEDRIADYVAGKGTHEFVAADSNFRATFPFGMPQRSVESQKAGPVEVEFVTYGTEAESGAFLVSVFNLPSGAPFDLTAGVNGAAVAIDGRVESATPTTFQGFPAMDFVITGTESGTKFVDTGIVVHSGSRIYMLQTLWENGPAPGYEAFKASFHIGG